MLQASPAPANWKHVQHFNVSTPGLVKLTLPLETLDAARSELQDLRLYDDAGNEVPYLVESPKPPGITIERASSFQVTLTGVTTVLTLGNSLSQPVDGVSLESPAGTFVKSVDVEGSLDGEQWENLAQGQPIFNQPGEKGELHVSFPAGVWRKLRLTVHDQRSQPIPFTGARIYGALPKSVPGELIPVKIVERAENPGESRLTLSLGAAHLDLASLQLETSEPVFMRQVSVAVAQVSQDTISDRTIAQGVVYRAMMEGQRISANLRVILESRIPSREFLLFIKNQDNPPLPITAIQAERRPVHLLFLARSPGKLHLLTGNDSCTAPHYDLASMTETFKTATLTPVMISPLEDNPNYKPVEVLAGIQEAGSTIDVSPWKFRKPITVSQAGVQQVDLDVEVLAHALPGLEDLRLVRSGKQWPYVLERSSKHQVLIPAMNMSKDAKDPGVTRWRLKMSQPSLPIKWLACTAANSLFQRDALLYEERVDDRGETSREVLGRAQWVQTPERPNKECVLSLENSPRTDTLLLETQNGNNPPITLEGFRLYCPLTRVLFKAQPGDELFMFYGNSRAASPRYDLDLVAAQLLSAEKKEAVPGKEEQLGYSRVKKIHGKEGFIFWGILALVVVGLLVIIARLLPNPDKSN